MAEDVFYIVGGTSSSGDAHISKYHATSGELLGRVLGNGINGTGGAVDPLTEEPYWTNFSEGTVLRCKPDLTEIEPFISGLSGNPESLVFRDDYIYIGCADGDDQIKRYDRQTGEFIDQTPPTTTYRGNDWISLHPDNITLYYTSETSGTIHRYDYQSMQQLTPFATPGGTLYTVLVRQSDQHVFLGGNNRIYHYTPDAELVRYYDPTPTPFVFAVCMDITERFLFVGDYSSGKVWKIDIATGEGTDTPLLIQDPANDSIRTGGIFSLGGTVIRSYASGTRVHFW